MENDVIILVVREKVKGVLGLTGSFLPSFLFFSFQSHWAATTATEEDEGQGGIKRKKKEKKKPNAAVLFTGFFFLFYRVWLGWP